MPKVSTEHRAEVRERLVAAAHDCLVDRGIAGFTTRNILERAGLSAGSLYHYFNGKDDLLVAVAERMAASQLPELGGAEDLAGIVRGLLSEVEPSFLPQLRAQARHDQHLRAALSRFDELVVARFAPMVERAQSDGRIDATLDAAALVELVEMVYEAVHAHLSAGTIVTSRERITDTFLSLVAQPQGAHR